MRKSKQGNEDASEEVKVEELSSVRNSRGVSADSSSMELSADSREEHETSHWSILNLFSRALVHHL